MPYFETKMAAREWLLFTITFFSVFSFLNHAKMVQGILQGVFAFILGPKAPAFHKKILAGCLFGFQDDRHATI